MTTTQSSLRKAKAFAERRELIVDTARAMAEADGWDSVTTRQLADAIGFSQPVLYSDFPGGKAEIMRAVATRGFTDITAAMTPARRHRSDRARFAAVVAGYLDFAAEHPAVYRAMFSLPIATAFGRGDAPDVMKDAFNTLATALRDNANPGRDVETSAEVLWSSLHGMATLERDERLRPEAHARRSRHIVDLFVGAP